MSLSISFHGAAGSVTGSKTLVETPATRLLVDCGLFQGLKPLRLRNWQPFPFDPSSLDAVLLTHAHIDHLGAVPRLVKQGYSGPVYCTPATRELAEILLLDSARIQEEDAEYANRKGFSKHHPALPLYDSRDAEAALRQFEVVDYGQALTLGDTFVQWRNAGHILGSSFVEMDTPGHRIVFSGDLGRYEMPLHPDPDPLPACDTLVLESTYGNRVHDRHTLEEQVVEKFTPVLEAGGVVLIPAFAVARAQLLSVMLRDLMADGLLAGIPVHIDSPMAVDVSRIYTRYAEHGELDPDVTRRHGGIFPATVQFHRSVTESMALNDLKGPRIIISASGMLAGGRVLHHLRRLGPQGKNLIALVGYQAEGTRGRALLEGARTLRMHGMDVRIAAKVTVIDGLSAHADANELVRWAQTAPARPATVLLNHGEPVAAAALRERVESEVGSRAFVPGLNAAYALDGGGWVES